MAPAFDYRDPAECVAMIDQIKADAHAQARRHATRLYETRMRRVARIESLMRRLEWDVSPRRKRVGA